MNPHDDEIAAAMSIVRACETQVEMRRAVLRELQAEGWDTTEARRRLAVTLLELELARMRLDDLYRQ
jgi:hypothetical protein